MIKTFEKIYQIVSKIPKGKVMTYKQIADILSLKNPRIIGFALKANKDPEKIPCHRVVASNGKLTGYAYGGISEKKKILKKESVIFKNEEKIDLEKSLLKTF